MTGLVADDHPLMVPVITARREKKLPRLQLIPVNANFIHVLTQGFGDMVEFPRGPSKIPVGDLGIGWSQLAVGSSWKRGSGSCSRHCIGSVSFHVLGVRLRAGVWVTRKTFDSRQIHGVLSGRFEGTGDGRSRFSIAISRLPR